MLASSFGSVSSSLRRTSANDRSDEIFTCSTAMVRDARIAGAVGWVMCAPCLEAGVGVTIRDCESPARGPNLSLSRPAYHGSPVRPSGSFGASVLHLFQRLALRLAYGSPDEQQGEQRGSRVHSVGAGEAGPHQQRQERERDGEVGHPVGGPRDNASPVPTLSTAARSRRWLAAQ